MGRSKPRGRQNHRRVRSITSDTQSSLLFVRSAERDEDLVLLLQVGVRDARVSVLRKLLADLLKRLNRGLGLTGLFAGVGDLQECPRN